MSSTLISCPPIGSHSLQRNDESRLLIVDHLVIKFTLREYRLLLLLLSCMPTSDTSLIQEALLSSEDASSQRQSIDKYIDKIRSKLQPSGLTIRRVSKYGYILLADPR